MNIAFTYRKLSLLNLNKIPAGGVAYSLWEDLQVVSLIYVLVELILGWKSGNASILIVT